MSSYRVKIVLSLALVTLLIALAGAPACRQEAATVKVGALYPLTGALATAGADAKNGILLAVDIVNNEYDLDMPLAKARGLNGLGGAKLEVVFADSQGSPAVGKAEAGRLIQHEKVSALIGCYQSQVTAEASQVAEEKSIPFLCDISTAPSLTQRGFNWFFRTTPHEETCIQNSYQFLDDTRKAKEVEIEKLAIVSESSLWGSEFAKYVGQYADRYGYQVVADISYSADATDVTAEVQRLKDADPDVVMQASYTQDAILYAQTYKKMGFSPDAILAADAGFTDAQFFTVLGKDADYLFSRQNWGSDLAQAKPLVGTIARMFREQYGMDMNDVSSRAFTGMLVLADAINRAGSTSPQAIRSALLATNIPGEKLIMPWDGIRFDPETHQNTLAQNIICQSIDGEYHTVWPPSLAIQPALWPMPQWEEREQAKVAMLFNSPDLETDEFNKGCLAGGKRAESELGIKLDYAAGKETTQAETERRQRQYAATGEYSLIVIVGATQMEALKKIAAEFPQQRFALIDGEIADMPNVTSLLFRDEESSFLAGALAGMVSKTGKIGFIGGMDIPVIHRFLAGYRSGAKYVNPRIEVEVSYAGSWSDPEAGKQLALSQYSEGADIIFGAAGSSVLGVFAAAKEKGLYTIGVDADQSHLAPDNILASTLKGVDTAVFTAIKEALQANLRGGIRSLGLEEDGVGISVNQSLPLITRDMQQQLAEIKRRILAHEIEVPTK